MTLASRIFLLAPALLLTMMLSLLGASRSFAAASTAIPDEVTHLRDPFKKPAVIHKTAPKSDLELFALDQFKLLAVMTGPKRLRAMVAAPNGKTYLVWENMRIGIRKGVIRRITPDAIHVREQVINVLGQEENVDSDIRMNLTAGTLGTAQIAPAGSESADAAAGAGAGAGASDASKGSEMSSINVGSGGASVSAPTPVDGPAQGPAAAPASGAPSAGANGAPAAAGQAGTAPATSSGGSGG